MGNETVAINSVAIAGQLMQLKRISPLGIRTARFFASRITDEKGRENFEILLLLLLAAMHRGFPRARPEDFAACLYTGGASAENENITKNITSWFYSIVNQSNREKMRPLFADGFTAGSVLQPLVIYDESTGTVSFQALYWSETYLAWRLTGMVDEDSGAIVMERASEAIVNAIKKSFSDRQPHLRQIGAALLAIKRRFLVISGGPGTGKSTIVHLVLRAVCEYHHIPIESVVLCAPTGRAKARLLESVTVNLLPDDPLYEIEAYTIHSLIRKANREFPENSDRHKLRYHFVVIDEASMMDIVLFASLLKVLPPDCRILLVGDTEQLPPIDAGAVLGDLACQFEESTSYGSLSRESVEEISALTQKTIELDGIDELPLLAAPIPSRLVDHIIFLTRNYRSEKGILAWWQEKSGAKGSKMGSDDTSSVTWYNNKEKTLAAQPETIAIQCFMEKWIGTVYQQWKNKLRNMILFDLSRNEKEVADMLRQFSSLYKILCCVNDGSYGKKTVNDRCDRLFRQQLGEQATFNRWHDGQPVTLQRNQYQGASLYNGDTGIVLENQGEYFGCFPSKNTVLKIPLRHLLEPDLGFAVSVHKAQGSEYDEVTFIIPAAPLISITRQLVYTAVTRARKRLYIADPSGCMADIASLPNENRYGLLRDIFR